MKQEVSIMWAGEEGSFDTFVLFYGIHLEFGERAPKTRKKTSLKFSKFADFVDLLVDFYKVNKQIVNIWTSITELQPKIFYSRFETYVKQFYSQSIEITCCKTKKCEKKIWRRGVEVRHSFP